MSERKYCSCRCDCSGLYFEDRCPHNPHNAQPRVVATFRASIYLSGDIDTAKQWLRRFAYDVGLCVTVTPTTFIYTGGEETGLNVGLVNYPKFPKEPQVIHDLAVRIARGLVVACCQRTALVVSDLSTEWIQTKPPGEAR